MRRISRQVDSRSIDVFTFETDDSSQDFIVESFVDWLADYISSGAEFTDGQTLEYGYTLFNCRVESRGLHLLAPDFQSMPIQWIGNLGPAFRIVASHKYIPESFGFAPDIPTLRNTAIVGKLFDQLPMFANRDAPLESNPNDSGWFIGSTRDDVDNNDPDELRIMSLYEAMLAVPQMLEFLSLPVGCQVLFSGDNPVVLQHFRELEIPKGSYLDQRLKEQ